MTALRLISLLVVPALFAPSLAAALEPARDAAEAPLSLTRWDGAAVARALFDETNRRRAAAGLPAFAPLPAAEAAARVQAEFIARTRTLSHSNPAPGQSSVGDRLRSAGAAWRFAAENVLYDHLLEYEAGRSVYPRPAAGGGQEFSYTPNGPALLPRTPRGFARAALDQWMNSPGHRRNILSPDTTHLGCAAVPVAEGKAAGLGLAYAAQVFLALGSPDAAIPSARRPLGR